MSSCSNARRQRSRAASEPSRTPDGDSAPTTRERAREASAAPFPSFRTDSIPSPSWIFDPCPRHAQQEEIPQAASVQLHDDSFSDDGANGEMVIASTKPALFSKDPVRLTLHGHPNKPISLDNLGNSLRTRFEHLGELHDLDDAILIHKDAVQLTVHGYPNQPRRLNILGNALLARFKRLRELRDLDDAISTHKDTVQFMPHDHPNKPMYLSNLGDSPCARFGNLGESRGLDDAILTHREALELIPHGHPDKHMYLNDLGDTLRTRFLCVGEQRDLNDAISAHRNAIELIPHGHPDKPSFLSSLGSSLLSRFTSLGDLRDLDDVICALEDAVILTPHGHPDKSSHLNSLGNSFRTRFERLGEVCDLDNATATHKDAVGRTPHGHLDKPSHLNCLGNSSLARFVRLGELRDLDYAISAHRDAVGSTPHGHPKMPCYLSNLGNGLLARFERFGEARDAEGALSAYSHAAFAPFGPIRIRFCASLDWISCAHRIHHRSLLRAYHVAIGLLPQLAWIGLSLAQRYAQLMSGANVVREAAAAALDAGFPELAVEWLEQGRSIVWGEILQLRSSYEELASAHPDHAHRFQELSIALDRASATRERSKGTVDRGPESLRQEADRHRALAIERDNLLEEIRRLPGFDGFLRCKCFSQLRASAHAGPVVVLNTAESRCDALIVLANVDHVIHVPLPRFTMQHSANLRSTLKGLVRRAREGQSVKWEGGRWEALLSLLWKCVVQPALEALAFSVPPGGDLSRIFWCPTGTFVFLPIHAAGLYDDCHSQPGHKVSDFVVSSYTPSLTILAPAPAPRRTSDDLRFLLVPQPPTDGQRELPGVVTELARIREVVRNSPSACTTLVEPSVGTVEEVLCLMKDADWVHFACHGVQDGVDSGLCLADGRRLKVRDVVALSRPRGGLAFLSACQTATGEKCLADEAVHIAVGMFAGYAGVVGTMWSISDKLAPDVARDVYGRLFRNGTRPDHREAAYALHDAIGDLRDRVGASFDEWVPFIHMGL